MPSSPASEGGDRAVDQEAVDQEAPEAEAGIDDGGRGDARSPDGTELSELRERAADLEDRYKRALADRDNYRKRSAAELERRVAEAGERVNREWLDAVDSVERALRGIDPVNPMAEGLRAVLEQMEAVLERQGISRVGAVGEPFDPELHEAVGVVETDQAPDRTVVDLARSGWATGDRVLRPAQVIVSRRPGSDG
jgi:molecular chaperone GrpE